MENESSQAVIETPLKLQSLLLEPSSGLVGRAIRDSRIRDVADGLVVGIERQGFRQINPPPDLTLEPGDRLWIVGDPDKLAALNKLKSGLFFSVPGYSAPSSVHSRRTCPDKFLVSI